jgi:heme/copper-type cytochrome/quinol oxidase subunit 3
MGSHHEEEILPHGTLTPGKFCMWIFLGSDAMGFATFVAAYIVLRMTAVQWIPDGFPPPPIGLTGLNTFILIVSSVTMVKAHGAICEGDIKGFRNWLAVTLLCGVTFLGIQYFEWSHLLHGSEDWYPLTPWMGPYGATFFSCTGYHGLHVLAGVIYIFVMLVRTMLGYIQAKDASEIEILGLYWHFVDLVWILLFTVIYLIP